MTKRLAEQEYKPMERTPGMWKHEKRNIAFVLVVDDFRVKYVNKEDADHLFPVLQLHYKVKIKMEKHEINRTSYEVGLYKQITRN